MPGMRRFDTHTFAMEKHEPVGELHQNGLKSDLRVSLIVQFELKIVKCCRTLPVACHLLYHFLFESLPQVSVRGPQGIGAGTGSH